MLTIIIDIEAKYLLIKLKEKERPIGPMVQRQMKAKGSRFLSAAIPAAIGIGTKVISTAPWTAPVATAFGSGAFGPSKSAAAGLPPLPRQTKRRPFFDRNHTPQRGGTHFG